MLYFEETTKLMHVISCGILTPRTDSLSFHTQLVMCIIYNTRSTSHDDFYKLTNFKAISSKAFFLKNWGPYTETVFQLTSVSRVRKINFKIKIRVFLMNRRLEND